MKLEQCPFCEEVAELVERVYSWWMRTRKRDVLKHSGGGSISVPVADIVGSKKVQAQVAEVREIETAIAAKEQP